MGTSTSNRILATPSSYAKKHYYYVQEIGTLQSLGPHISARQDLRSCLFFMVLSGSGHVTVRGTRYALSPGDCVWIDCGGRYEHESSTEDPWRLSWVHYYGPEAGASYELFAAQGLAPVFRPRSPLVFEEALRALYEAHREKSAEVELLSNKYLTDLVTACLQEALQKEEGEYTAREKLLQAHRYLEENYSRKIRLDDIAAALYMSKFYLSREFKKYYGASLMSELAAIRISHAKSLLRFSDSSVEQIAELCGFQDAGYFIRIFRESEDTTPLAYRKKWTN
ncbi:MAG: AraC family transcriptional regulator [Eubacteriales bacterium]|nr:AraC family transcriptional regulator [Eubacteriales bacterium]